MSVERNEGKGILGELGREMFRNAVSAFILLAVVGLVVLLVLSPGIIINGLRGRYKDRGSQNLILAIFWDGETWLISLAFAATAIILLSVFGAFHAHTPVVDTRSSLPQAEYDTVAAIPDKDVVTRRATPVTQSSPEVRRAIPVVHSTPSAMPFALPRNASSPQAPEPFSTVTADRFLRAAATEFITSANSPTVDDEIALYAEQVDFYDEGIKNRTQIRAEITNERRRWASRHYQVSNVVKTDYDPATDIGSVTVIYTYQVSNAQKRKAGEAITQIVFRSVSGDPKVIRVTEQRKQ
jgi:hypothetical protein